MEYDFKRIEKEWQKKWNDSGAYKVENNSSRPKYYVLDMFPYPSGAGLHVGHPLGYIASDIYARFKRLKGFNVLHPMGYDAFGLPAEQYAIDQGIHPAVSTENNIKNFRSQLDKLGFCFDWDREVNTSKPEFYKWTQWIFLQLFGSFYNRQTNKAERIAVLIAAFEKEGNKNHPIPDSKFQLHQSNFSAADWKAFKEKVQQEILMEYRLAYCGIGEVNWCEALGTVLANDEVINGVSERGGYPVVKKKLRQWYLRITEYADRLLEGLEKVDFSEAMKEMQGNWIGKSSGAEIDFRIRIGDPVETRKITYQDSSVTVESVSSEVSENDQPLTVYTTRPDTIFGVDFMVIAPEHELVEEITTTKQKQAVDDYIAYVKSRSERERMAEKKISGVFTGAYALNPFNGREIPIWISEYVLIGYGTGAIMAVPCGDQRDFLFAKHFNIPITNIIGRHYNGEEANPTKDAILENSGFINGRVMKDAIEVVISKIVELGIGKKKVNYKMRDAAFSRQRYWGEPFPIVWKNGIAYPLPETELPLELPHVDSYKPGPDGEGPLANIKEWYLIPNPSPQVEKEAVGAANVPKYSVHAPVQFELARTMRKDHTQAEKKLWEVLRGKKSGVKFRRQHPIDAYIVDFISLQNKLIIEIDGGYHETEEQKKYDEERTRVLKEIGFNVIRFSNEEVLKNPYAVKNKIKEIITESSTNPPLRLRRGDGGEVQALRETNTMPGYAGSSWYFLRYMDPHNEKEFCNRKASDYWNQVDLYIGGTEHAVGHLLYSRLWTKALYDLGYIGHDEPYKKLVNQGMIQGSSRFVYRINWTFEMIDGHPKIDFSKIPQFFVSNKIAGGINESDINTINQVMTIINKVIDRIRENGTNRLTRHLTTSAIHVDVNIVDGYELDIDAFKKWRNGEYANAEFILEDNKYICGAEVEKMSKSKFNTVNPDDLVLKYGADTFRMYEMFLGPVEMSKPWDTKGIEGVHRFLKKLWRLFYDEIKGKVWTDEKATDAELKVLHHTIKKIENDTERFSFNTGVSAFMIAVNELNDLKCHKKEILEPLLILLAPYAPHIAEELYQHLQSAAKAPSFGGGLGEVSILNATYPKLEEKYLVESSKEYPVSVNGKLRTTINIALGAAESEVEQIVLANEVIKKWLEGKQPKKIIYKEGKMVNVVV
jgi:leucyl-tRNA synthetase